jgi:hypothetical protein
MISRYSSGRKEYQEMSEATIVPDAKFYILESSFME